MESEEAQVGGCKHYKRNCRIVAPCCDIVYPCRLCHNDNQAHEIDRKKIVLVECTSCSSDRQLTSANCSSCGILFAKYYCDVCKLWDDDGLVKNIYHCEGCGICRIGPKDKYFHCDTCCACYPLSLRGNHRCINGSMQNNCPICLEDMFSSRKPVVVLKCGHNIHSHCHQVMSRLDLLPSIRCPTCSKTTAEDPERVWKEIENVLAQNPMPEEIRDQKIAIQCNDCHGKSTEVALNYIAMKCEHCGSYNTQRI